MVRFIYTTGKYDKNKEAIVSNLYNKAKTFIQLPKTLEVEFKDLNDSVYAETVLDHRFKNRIYLNANIHYKEIIKPCLHELLHLNQIHTGRLSSQKNGMILWENKLYRIDSYNLSYKDYLNLPWELDVAEKEKILLQNILN